MDFRRAFGRSSIVFLLLATLGSASSRASANRPEGRIDATTLHGKVLCGYQGWFRCPGDSSKRGWRHWSRDSRRIGPDTLTFEMWPDLTEADADEKFPAPGFAHADGSPAYLFSSVHPKTVDRHFRWMSRYGIDGVFLQRFVVESDDRSGDLVLKAVRESAARRGRVYALSYDLTGAREERLFESLTADWKRLVDRRKILEDPAYLRHDGRPVLVVWGFFRGRFEAKTANRLIDFFQNDPTYRVTLVGGCQWWWRTEKDPAWAAVFRRFDVISPWNVGNVTVENGIKQAATSYWKDDLREAERCGMGYLPVLYPGFSWTNLKGEGAARETIPRLGGEFLRRQFQIAAESRIDMAQVAMFDEVDEGTAVFKVSNDPPKPGRFATLEGLPSDRYLRLVGEGTRLLRDAAESGRTKAKPR